MGCYLETTLCANIDDKRTPISPIHKEHWSVPSPKSMKLESDHVPKPSDLFFIFYLSYNAHPWPQQ
jgi:hypothetical protein